MILDIVELREKILSIVLQYPQYKLVGAYSIIKSMKNTTDWEPRATSDLDLRICIDVQPERNINHLVEVLTNNNLLVDVKITKNNNYKLIISDKENNKIKLDIEFKAGNDIQSNIKNISESLRDKMELVMLISDREFKNVVDVIICLQADFQKGISKKELLTLFEGINLHPIDLDTLLHLAQKFKPRELNGVYMEEYAAIFDTLLTGLLYDDINEECIFKNFKWQYS